MPALCRRGSKAPEEEGLGYLRPGGPTNFAVSKLNSDNPVPANGINIALLPLVSHSNPTKGRQGNVETACPLTRPAFPIAEPINRL
jgi:hypothetical protein